MSKLLMKLKGNVVLLLLALVTVAVLAGIIGFIAGRSSGKQAERVEAKKRDTSVLTNGHWGTVRHWNSMLEMPGDMISFMSVPEERTQWFIDVTTPEAVLGILKDCAISDVVATRIANTAQRWPEGGGMVVFPSDADLLAISSHARSKLYVRLARLPQNQTLADATRFSKVGMRDWLDDTGVSSQLTELIHSLIYSNGDTALFADYDVVLRRITDNREARRFLRTMARRNCIMGTLMVQPDDNIEDLARYWGRGGREQDVRTLLESARNSDGAKEIPLIMLMPQFVRDRLYRYRRHSDPEMANCHYTAMNFFKDPPEHSYTNLVTCAQAVNTDYVVVTDENYQLGDVILLMTSPTEVVHSCNYIAGNIVFTKNGSAQGQPWVMADLKETEGFFAVEKPIERRVIRRKDFVLTNI